MTPGVAAAYEQIRSRIENGVYAPGDPLPSANSLAVQFGVSRTTVQRAARALINDGWLAKRPSYPPVVRRPPQAPPTSLLAGTLIPVSNAHVLES